MIRVKPGPNTLGAFDISHYEPNVDWKTVVGQAHMALVMIKASEGAHVGDSIFKIHWANAKKNLLARIAYHFYHPSQDPIMQVTNFLGAVGELGPSDGLMIDWEGDDNEPANIDSVHGQAFLSALMRMSGKVPFMYGSPFFLRDLSLPVGSAKCPLVVAEYGVSAPWLPPPWPKWTVWQTSESKQIPGVVGPVDADLFNGTKADLDALLLSLNLPAKTA